jgi:hypothetical protein
MDPDAPQKPRWFVRWFSPLRWRSWACTFPLLIILTGAFLFCWPGLNYSWAYNERWRMERVVLTQLRAPDGVGLDVACLEAGPLELSKRAQFGPDFFAPVRSPSGFFARNEPRYTYFGYGNAHIELRVLLDKNWRPW